MKALITGGAGFLGSHLCDILIEHGHSVVAVDSCVTGSVENIKHHLNNPAFEFIQADVAEGLSYEGDLDFIFHFASPASPDDFKRIPLVVLKAGSYATHNALELAAQKGAKFMLASTSEVYGDPKVHPQVETYWGNVNSIGPRSCYDEAKRYAEAATVCYRDFYGVDTRIVRFFNTYGPRMRLDDGRVVPNFVKQALLGQPLTVYGTGQQTRSFGYVGDIIKGVYKLAMSNYQLPVNIGMPDERTILDFAQNVLALTGSKSEIQFLPASVDDPAQRFPDITVAKRELDWTPSTPLAEGLRITIESFAKTLGTTVG